MFQWLVDRRHRAFREDLSAYLDGQLSAQEKGRLEDHLSDCAACRRELDELRAVVDAVKSLPAAPVPRSFAIEPAAAPRPALMARPSLALGALSAAAVVLFAVVLGGDLLTQPGGEPVQEELAGEAMAPVALEAREEADVGAPAAGEMPAPEAAAPAPTVPAAAEAPESPDPELRGPEERDAELAPAPAAEERAPPPGGEDEAGSGRTVLRALEVALAVVFLAALGGAVWMRRRGGVR